MTIADLAPLALRASLGFFFFASGWRKTFNPDTHAHIVGLFARLRVSDRLVWVICVSELLGGLRPRARDLLRQRKSRSRGDPWPALQRAAAHAHTETARETS